jgi:crossover junction endodeoxyribonuclease RuvC
MRILGIDPGITRIGFGLIETAPLKLINYGTLETKNLLDMEKKFGALLKNHQPQIVAVETLFLTKNRKTAIEVAQARGVLLFKTLKNHIDLVELGPMQVKQAVTGWGRADKRAVAKMVKIILNIKTLTGYDDASDALAIAIAAANKKIRNEKLENSNGN